MNKILIEVHELKQLMQEQNVILVDTRAPAAYSELHIKGAINIHDIFTYLSSSTKSGIKAMRDHFASVFGESGIGNADTVVFYEDSMSSGYGQSCRGHFIADYIGLSDTKVLHGGLSAWRNAGGKVDDKAVPLPAKTFELGYAGSELIVNKDDVLKAINTQDITLLDVRDVEEWIGESSSPYGVDFAPRKGRLPGAKWLEWYRMMKPSVDGPRIKSSEEILAECQNIGLDFDKPIYLYCFKGARTSNTYVALKQAGFKQVATYFGSWNEWSRDPELPIEQGLPTA